MRDDIMFQGISQEVTGIEVTGIDKETLECILGIEEIIVSNDKIIVSEIAYRQLDDVEELDIYLKTKTRLSYNPLDILLHKQAEEFFNAILRKVIERFDPAKRERNRKIINEYFGFNGNHNNVSYRELGDKFGLSYEGVRRVIKKTKERLREELRKDRYNLSLLLEYYS